MQPRDDAVERVRFLQTVLAEEAQLISGDRLEELGLLLERKENYAKRLAETLEGLEAEDRAAMDASLLGLQRLQEANALLLASKLDELTGVVADHAASRRRAEAYLRNE